MACVSDSSTPPESSSSRTLGSPRPSSETPSLSSKSKSKFSKSSKKTSESSSSSSSSSSASSSYSAASSSLPPWLSPLIASSSSSLLPPPAPPFYLRFSPPERAFLQELTLLNGVIDRILPMLDRNPEPSLLSALCDYAARLIARSGCSLGQRTFYVFRALYRETVAEETRPYLVRRATSEVVDYIRRQQKGSKPTKNIGHQDQQQPKQKQSLEELLSIVVNVLASYIDNPRCTASFAPLRAVLQELGLHRDHYLSSLFAFSPAEAQLMRRAGAISDDGQHQHSGEKGED